MRSGGGGPARSATEIHVSMLSSYFCRIFLPPPITNLHATYQGLTLVHFPAQLKRFLWDRGAVRECFRHVWKVSGVIMRCLGCILRQNWLSLS